MPQTRFVNKNKAFVFWFDHISPITSLNYLLLYIYWLRKCFSCINLLNYFIAYQYATLRKILRSTLRKYCQIFILYLYFQTLQLETLTKIQDSNINLTSILKKIDITRILAETTTREISSINMTTGSTAKQSTLALESVPIVPQR